MTDRNRHFTLTIVFSAFCCGLLGVLFFPGLFAQDSTDCLAQALNIKGLDNWHPIIFTLLLKITTWNNTPYFILLQSLSIGLLLGIICAKVTAHFFSSTWFSTILAFCLAAFLIFYNPGIPLIVTVVKDSLFSYLLFFMIALLLLRVLSTKKIEPGKIDFELILIFSIGALGALFRHNGFILLWGSFTVFFMILFIRNCIPSKKNLLLVLAVFAIYHVTSAAFERIVAVKGMAEQNFSLKKWTIRADYVMAYIQGLMEENDVKAFKELVDSSLIAMSAEDTYLFNMETPKLQNGKSEQDFYQQAEAYLFANPRIWIQVKFNYSSNLMSNPLQHSVIFSGDLTNTKAQVDMDRFRANLVNLVITQPLQLKIDQRLSERFGIGTQDNLIRAPGFFYKMWNFASWLKYFLYAMGLFFMAEIIQTKKYNIFASAFIFLAAIIFFIWAPYLLISFANQSRYYFLTILVSKLAIGLSVIAALKTVRSLLRR